MYVIAFQELPKQQVQTIILDLLSVVGVSRDNPHFTVIQCSEVCVFPACYRIK